MARVVKEDVFSAKRNEILDVALKLVYTRGYDQMTIQDILDELRISKGALYHYFDSKLAILEALVERMGKEAEKSVLPVIQNPDLNAIEKFRRYFEASAMWKSKQKEFILSLMRMWYIDGNALIRQKFSIESRKHLSDMFEPIIRQGIREGVFTTRFPEQTAEIIIGITLSLSETVAGLLFAPNPDPMLKGKLTAFLDAYIDALERILGAPEGSLKVFEPDAFDAWWDAPEPMTEANLE